jgi:hypothetical protein
MSCYAFLYSVPQLKTKCTIRRLYMVKMKQDVDYTYQKTSAIASNLYGYIAKSILDYKFDSLKLRY